MLKSFVILGAALVLSGCAAVSTMPVSSLLPQSGSSLEVHSQTSIKLEQANFVVVKTNLVARSKGFALLGIITITPARFTKAMNQLYLDADMQAGRPQTLVNLTVERSSANRILFSIPEVAVRADLVEFVSEPAPEARPRTPAEKEPVPPAPPDNKR